MDRWNLINKTRELLSKAGFYVSRPHNVRSISFDIVARRDNSLLIIKVLQNADALTHDNSEEMKLLAEVLNGAPLVISEKSSSGKLEPGVIYSRMGIPILSYETLEEYLKEGEAPLVFAAPGGFYTRINGELLRKVREEWGISLGELASIAGVSRKAIQMYEEGMSAEVNVAIALEEYLQVPLIEPLDPFVYTPKERFELERFDLLDDFDRKVIEFLGSMGYQIFPTMKCPFDALTEKERDVLLTNIGEYSRSLAKKAEIVREVSDIAEQEAVIFLRREVRRTELKGVPIITLEELESISFEDLINLIQERKK
jgi:putative transcriptional regulator